MKIQPVASPAAIQQPPSNAQAMREKAIAAFTQQGDQSPVQNQNNVTPEELTAIKPPTGQEDSNIEAELAPTEAPKTPEEIALSRQFAQLARQEKAMRQKALQQEQQLKAREDALKAQEAKFSTPQDMSGYISKADLLRDPWTVLGNEGLTFEKLNETLLSTPVDPRIQAHIDKLEAKLAGYDEKFANAEKNQVQSQEAAYKAAVKQIEMDTKDLIASDSSFELIKTTNSVRDVVQLIEETYKKDGILMTVEEAAKAVEDYLEGEAIKLTRVQKIQQKMAASVAPKTPPAQTPGKTQQPQMKTLTNTTSTARQLSAKERAILAFKGELT